MKKVISLVAALAAVALLSACDKEEVTVFPTIRFSRIITNNNDWLVITKTYENPVSGLSFADALAYEVYRKKDELPREQIIHGSYTFVNHKGVKVGDMVKIKWLEVFQAPARDYHMPVIVEVK